MAHGKRRFKGITFWLILLRTPHKAGIPRKQFPRDILARILARMSGVSTRMSRGCYEDATRKLIPWNLNLTAFNCLGRLLTQSGVTSNFPHSGAACHQITLTTCSFLLLICDRTMSCFAEIELIPWILTLLLCLLIGVEVHYNLSLRYTHHGCSKMNKNLVVNRLQDAVFGLDTHTVDWREQPMPLLL